MSLVIKNTGSGGGDKFIVPEGVHIGLLVRVIDLGVQEQRPYKGEARPDTPQLRLVFELPHELVGDKPAFVSKTVKKSAHPKSTLFKIASALLGGGSVVEKSLESEIPVDKLLGRGAQIQVSHFEVDGSPIAYVASVLPLTKGTTVAPAVSELLVFDLANPDQSVLDKLSEMTRKKISEAKVLTSTSKSVKVEKDNDEF